MRPPRMFAVTQLLCMALMSALSIECYQHFCGGSISFEADVDPNDQTKLKVHLDILTGWVLGQGPCGPGCSKASIGTSTHAQRTVIESDPSYGPTYFGYWIKEHKLNGLLRGVNITDAVNMKLVETVIAVNDLDKWEQEWLRVNLTVERTVIDILFEGYFWRALTFQMPNDGANWRIHAKILEHTRNDTGKPNQNPKAMFKPIYRVQLNRVSTITISAVEPDGDGVECRPAVFFGQGGVYTNDARMKNIQTDRNCSILINADENDGFADDMWLAYVVDLMDYNKQPLIIDSDVFAPYMFTLSKTSVQFLIHVVDDLDTPRFIHPTKEHNHEFVLFADANWTTTVYVIPPDGRTIAEIEYVSRNGEHIQAVGPFDLEASPGAKYMTLFWAPTDADIGSHLVCVRAVDNTGMDSQTDERCYRLYVKGERFSDAVPNPNGPYFIRLPENSGSNQLVYEEGVTYGLPVVAHSDKNLHRIEVTTTTDYEKGNITSTGTSEFTMNFLFTPATEGALLICFVAVDLEGNRSPETCFNGTVRPPDPCWSGLCKNGAVCSRDASDPGDFACTCLDGFFQKDCSERIDVCANTPCKGRCFSLPSGPYCHCDSGYTGNWCDFKIGTCQSTDCYSTENHGICSSNGTHSTCQCYPRYTGADCNTDTCPGSMSMHTCLLQCPRLSAPAHGFMDAYSTTTGALVHIKCISGYKQTGSGTRVCQEDGTWSGSDTVCRVDSDAVIG